MSDPLELTALIDRVREQGVAVGLLELERLQRALAQMADVRDLEHLRTLARVLMVKRREDRPRFERGFDAWVAHARSFVEAPVAEEANEVSGENTNEPEPTRDDILQRIRPEAPAAQRSAWISKRFRYAVVAILGTIVGLTALLGAAPGLFSPVEITELGPPVGTEIDGAPDGLRGVDGEGGSDEVETDPKASLLESFQTQVPRIKGDPIPRAPVPSRLAFAVLAVLAFAGLTGTFLWFRRRVRELEPLSSERRRYNPQTERRRRIHWSCPDDLLLGADQAREMSWGIERFVTDEWSPRIDLAATVCATADHAGVATIRRERPLHDRTLWLWYDTQPRDPTVTDFAAEAAHAVARSGLPVRRAFFHGVPQQLRWLDGPESFTPQTVEAHREGTIVAILTDGRALRAALGDARLKRDVVELLRHLAGWPRLVTVLFGEDRSCADLLNRYGITCVAPDELANTVQRASAETDTAQDSAKGDDSGPSQPTLSFWTAALALTDQPFDHDLARLMQRELGLVAGPFDVDHLLAASGVEEDGLRFRVEAEARRERLDWLAHAERHRDDDGVFRPRPSSRAARAIAVWRRRIDAQLRGEAAEDQLRERHLRLEDALLRLWFEPAAAVTELEQLAGDGLDEDLRERLARYAPAGSETEDHIRLPWRYDGVGRGGVVQNAPVRDISQPTWRRLARLGFASGLLEEVPATMPPLMRGALATLFGLALTACLGMFGGLGWLRTPSPPVIDVEAIPPGAEWAVERSGTGYELQIDSPKLSREFPCESAEILTLTWDSKKLQNKETPMPGVEVWHLGYRDVRWRPLVQGWPSRSVLWVALPEGLEESIDPKRIQAWRYRAGSLLDQGTIDLAIIGPASPEVFGKVVAPKLRKGAGDVQLAVVSPGVVPADVLPVTGRVSLTEKIAPDSLAFAPVRVLHASESIRIETVWPETQQLGDLPVLFASRAPRPRMDLVSILGGRVSEKSTSPVQGAEVKAFLIGRYEVTRAQWLDVMGQPPKDGFYPVEGSSKLPANNVSWFDAIVFCNRLSAAEGLAPCYFADKKFAQPWVLRREEGAAQEVVQLNPVANGYRLPTEEAWEYAIRAGTDTKYFWGNESAKADECAWYSGNSEGRPHEVGLKQANGWRLHDMTGNVWEWCWDWHDDDKDGRVLRGGSFDDSSGYLASSFRSRYWPTFRFGFFGFRCVRSAVPQHGSTP